jgi:hypothetical protein
MDTGIVEQTWAEVGCKVRPLRRMVFVRTLPLAEKIGSIYLPMKMTKFHGELPHQKTIRAVVLSTGSKCAVKPGEHVCFTRLHFAWWKKLEDGCMVGWIDENQLTGYFEGEPE